MRKILHLALFVVPLLASLMLLLFPLHVWGAELLVSDSDKHGILRYDAFSGSFIDQFVSSESGGLTSPLGMAWGRDGNLFVSSFSTDSVFRYHGNSGEFIDVFASGGGLDGPVGLVFGPDGNLYVCSIYNDRVLRYDGETGEFIDVFASEGGLDGPYGLIFGPDGNLYVSNSGVAPGNILRFNGKTGEFIDEFVPHWSSPLSDPLDITFGPDQNLYVVSRNTSSILRFNGLTGDFIDTFATGGGLLGPIGLAFGPDGNLYVSDVEKINVLRFDGESGEFMDVFIDSSDGNLEEPRFLLFRSDLPEVVRIDIKPGVEPNNVNPRSRGVLPVAILTTETFDATTVDPLSVEFGPQGTGEAHERGHFEDVDGDGDLDLVFHFFTEKTGIVCGATFAFLTGETYDGQIVEGSDSINTVGCVNLKKQNTKILR